MPSEVQTAFRLLLYARNIFIVVITPFVLLPLILLKDGNDTSTLFIGGLIVATAIEHWNIHKRLALKVLMLVGTEPRWLMFGMMLPTWFLSMWMSNTATTAMMIPIAKAVLLQIKETRETEERVDLTDGDQEDVDIQLKVVVKNGEKDSSNCSRNMTDDQGKPSKEAKDAEKREQAEYSRMCKALSLGIAYSANCGGMATPTGTGPSVVMKGASDIAFEEKNATSPVSFATWMQYCLPISTILLILVWVFLQIIFLRCKTYNRKSPEQAKKVKQVIRRQYEELGPITFGQGAAIVHFVLLALLWVTRKLGGVRGWGDLFPEKTVTDSTPAILIAISLFLFPSVLPHKFKEKGKPLPPLLPWKAAEKNIPWGVVLLLGGGFAIAKGSKESGLSKLIGEQLRVFKDFDPWVMNLVLCFMAAAATEVTSNIAICSLMMPIMKELAITLQVNPLYFMFPTAIATSFAFMLPVATPPNAVVFSYGFVRVLDMVVAGFPVNIIAVLVLVIGTETWGEAIFGFHTLPDAFKLSNDTTALTNVTTTIVNSMSTIGPSYETTV